MQSCRLPNNNTPAYLQVAENWGWLSHFWPTVKFLGGINKMPLLHYIIHGQPLWWRCERFWDTVYTSITWNGIVVLSLCAASTLYLTFQCRDILTQRQCYCLHHLIILRIHIHLKTNIVNTGVIYMTTIEINVPLIQDSK